MTTNERGAQIWPALALCAQRRMTLTYEQLGKLIGVFPPSALGQLLAPIQDYCLARRLPPLTALVVSSKTGLPGSGFKGAEDVPAAHEQVFAYDWPAGPTPAEFA